jgi:DNA-directed RNA polymerase specialized sigma24 family protein
MGLLELGWCPSGREAVGEPVDEQVVEQARRGDEEAWRALVARHVGLVQAICRGYGLKGETATDVNQVVWLRLVEHLPRIRTPDAISGWIAATTRAECLNPRRNAGRISWAATSVSCDGKDLIKAFLRIGVRCQRLLRLAVSEPRPGDEEISAALDVDAGAVASSCERCLERLARLLDEDEAKVLAELRRIVADDNTMPSGWEAAASAAFGWLVLDAPVAERVYDSTTLGAGATPVVGNLGEVRQLRFAAGPDGIELILDAKDDEILLTGNLRPRRPADVTARWPDGAEVVRSDDDGLFRFQGLPLVPLSVHVDGENRLKTGWVVP